MAVLYPGFRRGGLSLLLHARRGHVRTGTVALAIGAPGGRKGRRTAGRRGVRTGVAVPAAGVLAESGIAEVLEAEPPVIHADGQRRG